MSDLKKRYYELFLNLFFSLIIFWLLFTVSLVNTENIFQLNLWDIYTTFYFLYFFISLAFLFWYRFYKIKNPVLNRELLYTIKSILFISVLLIPSFYLIHYFILEHIDESNLYLRAYWK